MNKTVLITGASRGIGRAIAMIFAEKGYDIIGTYHNREDLMIDLKPQIESHGVRFEYYKCDHSDFDSSKTLINSILQNRSSIDVLVNNAGISVVGLLQDITNDEWNNLWNTNVTSVVSMCREVIPIMLRMQKGMIINISSVWGNVGASCECAYSATKGAINTFTKALAKELAPSNIQVNAICCGIIDTDMNSHLTSEDLSEITNDIPLGRIGTPDDIAKAVYAITESGPYMTGQLITVDGGWI